MTPGFACAQQSGSLDLAPAPSDLQFSGSSRAAEIGPAEGFSVEPSSPSDILSSEPRSLPVAVHGQEHVGDALDAAALANVPHVCDTPVVWGQQVAQPPQYRSAIMHILMRDECNSAALWAGYPAERAAECAHMWSKLNREGGCKSCKGGCGCDSQTVQLPKRDKFRPLNRYRQESCDSCDALARAQTSPNHNAQLASHPTHSAGQQPAHQHARSAAVPHPTSAIQPAFPSQAPTAGAMPGRTSPTQPPAYTGRPPYTASVVPHQQAAVPVSYRR